MRPLVLAAALTALAAPAAWAQEVIATAGAGDPPKAGAAAEPVTAPAPAATGDPEAIGRWAKAVMAGQSTEPPAEKAAADVRDCPTPTDGKPHGEVWGGVGTGGYREIGAVVTQPVGKCGSVTVAVSKSEGRGGRLRRR